MAQLEGPPEEAPGRPADARSSRLKGILLLLVGVAMILGGFVLERVVFNASLGVQVAVGVALAFFVVAAIGYSIVSALSVKRGGTRLPFLAGNANGLRAGMLLTGAVIVVMGIVIAIVR